ncbi:MAG TPA: diguanylate cyclase [Planctomycetota bacterium]|nr:diguanylate cyclase [Planctomycetota bacterium]
MPKRSVKRTTVVLRRGERTSAPALVEPDYVKEGHEIDLQLLRALVLGRKRSSDIQLLLDAQFERTSHPSGAMRNSQMLALLLADLSVPEEKAAATFKRVLQHQRRLQISLRRAIGLKTAAMDYLENIERALKIQDDENAPSYSQLTQMAYTDQLTGLANYRFFTQRLRDEVKRCERYGHLLSLLMADLDLFKDFNDRYGHPAGNKALQQIARTVYAEVRDTDLLARYGGEEFALILPHTTKTEAIGLAERVRARVEGVRMQLEGRLAEKLTVCVGVATLPRDAHCEDSLLSAADQALYQAKYSGRNRVCVFVPNTRAPFRFTPKPADSVQKVSVIGEFNDWKGDADPMARNERGAFELAIPLVPGRYHYKLLLDGKEYLPDPECETHEPDGYGGMNSVVTVK